MVMEHGDGGNGNGARARRGDEKPPEFTPRRAGARRWRRCPAAATSPEEARVDKLMAQLGVSPERLALCAVRIDRPAPRSHRQGLAEIAAFRRENRDAYFRDERSRPASGI